MTASCLWAIVPAAGHGSRFGQSVAKQYAQLLGKSVIEHSITAILDACPDIAIYVAIAEGDKSWGNEPISRHAQVHTVIGGENRAASVLAGLNALENVAQSNDYVLVHDAARPCVSLSDVQAVVLAASEHPVGALLATPLTDTLKRADTDLDVTDTLDRSGLYQALTPQVFRVALLRDAILLGQQNGQPITDESSALEYAGFKPRICVGARSNIKVTFSEDLVLAESFFSSKERGEPKCV
ncbi:MAG: 2-C-methyl-D-erythritol 4-phosphate cytidylyltransferase [Pseudomonadales bacterium]